MKRLPTLILFALLAAVAAAQTVTKTELARDNGRGKPGTVVTNFAPTDNPLHCVLYVKKLTGPTVFTSTLTAVSAETYRNYRVISTSITGPMGGESLDFKFSLERPWPKGSYKIELKVDGKKLKTVNFEIKD